MKKRILAIVIALALLFTAMPLLPISASDTVTEVWRNGGLSIKDVDAVTDLGYDFKKVNVTDARGYIPSPNLDEAPYYLMVGMDGQYPSGHWMQLHISSGERNSNWNPKGAAADMYISFPNPNNKNITVFHGGSGETVMSGVAFMPQTVYIFKFVKEKNSEGTDVLAVYCNGEKVFENADQLGVFSGDNLWFTTNANVGTNDTLQTYPMIINISSSMTEDPASYFTTGPKGGCDGYSIYSEEVIAENMTALYDDDGFVRAVLDSTHHDGGNSAQVGESISTNVSNANKKVEISVIGDSLNKGNWSTIGIYDPSTGVKDFASSQYVIRINMNNNSYNKVDYTYLNEEETAILTTTLLPVDARLNPGELNKYTFELIEADVDKVNFYYNDALFTTVLETDENAATLFDIMRADTLRVGIVGNKGTDTAEVIRFKVNNGTKFDVGMTLDKEAYSVGDYITATTVIKNATEYDEIFTVSSDYSAPIVPVDNANATVTVKAGETIQLIQKFRAVEGGRPMLNIKVSRSDGNVLFNAKPFVSISGAGWYEGDSHSHSVGYSDGSATVAANSASAYEKGLSWLYSTDHNNIGQWVEAAAINESYSNGDFLNIAGNEFTSSNRGHSVGYRLPYDNELSNFADTPNQWNWTVDTLDTTDGENWNQIIASVNNMGGIFYVAHPNSGTKLSNGAPLSFPDVYDVVGITGIEVWNNCLNVKHLQNQVGFKIWDQLNVRGDKLLGIANSDGHGTAPIGGAHIKGYLTDLSQDNINNLLEGGSYYGTNGPDLAFKINGVDMGETLYISGDTSEANITVKASDDNYPLTKVTLYKLQVTGTISEEAAEVINVVDEEINFELDSNTYTDTKEVVKEWDLSGQNLYEFSEVVNLTVASGDFYRIEVESEKNTLYDGSVLDAENEIGFAYSNPIWVETADSTNDIIISDISIISDNAVVKETKNGNYYIKMISEDTYLTADDLSITLDGNATLTSKKYDSANNAFVITITAEDGTVKTLTVYVVGTVAESDTFWMNGGLSKSNDLYAGYSDMGYGFTRLTVTDARGYIETPNLDEAPYYMMLGMDGLISGGWAQLHISGAQRNMNWNPDNEIYIVFPNDSTSPRNILIKSTANGAAYNSGVLFIPQTAYIFKFAKEQDSEGNDVLVIYINGQKAFESAEALQVFSGSQLWFNTRGNTGDADVFTKCPLMIDAKTGITEDPDFYYLAGPKGGHEGVTWFHVYGLLEENMLALYDDNGFSRTVIDSTHNDGGNTAQVGESVTVDMPNPNKEFEISVIGESLNSQNWATIGIYDATQGIRSFAESDNTIRFNMNNETHSALGFYYTYNEAITLMPFEERVVEGELNRIRFELVEGEVDVINVFYNDVLQTTVLETDENTEGLFTIMNSETLRIGIVGHKLNENPDIIRFKVNNSSTSLGSLAVNMQDGATIREAAPEGLRFAAGFTAMDTLPSDAEIEAGMLIVPSDYLADGTLLTKEALDTAEKSYIDIDCNIWDGDSIKAVISNIKSENLDREFTARAYAKVTFANGTVKLLYAEQTAVGSYAAVSAVS